MIFSKQPTFQWLIVGLGNPGLQYENTRHNVGFMTADLLMNQNNGFYSKNKFEAVFGECTIGQSRVIVAKPQTYMNNSGRAVTQIAAFYKIPKDKIIIIFDDISLDVGKIRMRRNGSHGGHNGMKDIIELMGDNNISRIKIGVGQKPHPDYNLADWVLSKFPQSDKENLDAALEKATKAVKEIITKGIDSAMNKYNN
ncbi:MAG: aminoacyl-tRNA hydrolase [Clostridia bacterium]|nr:aminoacyl-tRNA hydrolase [Clostridia bacterium]